MPTPLSDCTFSQAVISPSSLPRVLNIVEVSFLMLGNPVTTLLAGITQNRMVLSKHCMTIGWTHQQHHTALPLVSGCIVNRR